MTTMTRFQQGFTLVEAIAVIAVTAVVAAAVAVFVRGPVLGYVDTVRRAELTDSADTALRRMGRDLRLAVPNSVRVDGTAHAVEFLLAKSGGRYRAACIDAASGDPLVFGDASAYACEAADNKRFDVLGPLVDVTTSDSIVIFNLGISGADAYAGDTLRPSATTGTVANIAYTGSQFPFPSPNNRFQVVEGPVSYVCDLAAHTLTRYWGYPVTAGQSVPPAGGSSALLAKNVSDCVFAYNALAVAQRAGLASLWLALSQSGDNVTLYHEVHVSNVP